MSVTEDKLFSFEDGTDEFEVIQNDAKEEKNEKNIESKIDYLENSLNSLVCSDKVANSSDSNDLEDSLPVSMYSSMSGQSQNIFESVYSFPSSVQKNQTEKLVNLLQEEQIKNRNILEQIFTMVTDFSKEKNDISDFRNQTATYKLMLEEEREVISELTHEFNMTKKTLQETAQKLEQFTEDNNLLQFKVDMLNKQLKSAELLCAELQEKLTASKLEVKKRDQMINKMIL